MTLTKDILLKILNEESDRYLKYLEACTKYDIKPDVIAQAKYSIKIQTLEELLNILVQ